jgi:hypothetical protein
MEITAAAPPLYLKTGRLSAVHSEYLSGTPGKVNGQAASRRQAGGPKPGSKMAFLVGISKK